MLNWLRVLILGEQRILVELARIRASQTLILDQIGTLMTNSEELSADLTELGTAVDDLSGRIDALPTSVDEITQDQLDSLRSSVDRVKTLAVAAPEVPTTV